MWITWAMFMAWSGARPPIREAIVKKWIHITCLGLPGRRQKHTVHCVFFFKKNISGRRFIAMPDRTGGISHCRQNKRLTPE